MCVSPSLQGRVPPRAFLGYFMSQLSGSLLLIPPRNLLKPVHPEDSTEHAQKQGQLQEDQDLEVDGAEQGPVGM